MKKIITGVVIGILLSSAIFIPFTIFVRNNQKKMGRYHGEIIGKLDTLKFLNSYFHKGSDPPEIIDSYPVKDGVIYVVETNGVKTIQTR
jgi:hypothetical protein